MNSMEGIFEIRSCLKILVNVIKIYIISSTVNK